MFTKELSRNSLSLAIVGAGVLIAGAILFTHYYPTTDVLGGTAPVPSAQAKVPAPSQQDHWYGSRNAEVVLIEYSDFQCPYCASVYPTLKRIVDESGGEVAWIHRNFALDSIHPEARPAATAAECIAAQLGDEGFWTFADNIYTNQSNLSFARYSQVAQGLGADMGAFSTCVLGDTYADKLDKEYVEALQNGGSGTPFTVIYSGGRQAPVSGALSYQQFTALISAVKQ